MTKTLPRHLAIIMDGNGRWAEERGLARNEGHKAGAEKLYQVARWCRELGLAHLSVYAFSTENWKRPMTEVMGLMSILLSFFHTYEKELAGSGIRIRFAGKPDGLPAEVLRIANDVSRRTAEQKDLEIVICLNYGGRDELCRAVRKIAKGVQNGQIDPESIDEEMIAAKLDLPDLADPDLIIRPGGEHRLSNFWLWQSAYSEYYFIDELWPDFRRESLEEALNYYASRERRFGRSGQQLRQESKA